MSGSGSKWLADKALAQLRNVPRIGLTNIQCVGRKPIRRARINDCTRNHNAQPLDRRMRKPAIGYEHMIVPKVYKVQIEQTYNYGYEAKRQYPPLALQTLQLMIDTGRLDPSQPIDLASICNTKAFDLNPDRRHFGVHLTDEGADRFEAKVNIEVQYASEQAIAAVERNGGVIKTAYFNLESVIALSNPLNWFSKGKAVPKRLHPPADALKYYIDAKNRGYLAHPEKIAEERFVLAQKYGYDLPEIITDNYLLEEKDPKQVFYGLHPGWLVNLADKEIYKPTEEEHIDYYKT